MEAKFDNSTQDIHLLLTQKELTSLDGDGFYTPPLVAKLGSDRFVVRAYPETIFGQNPKLPFLSVDVEDQEGTCFLIKLNQQALNWLASEGMCRERYGQSSKINLFMGNSWEEVI